MFTSKPVFLHAGFPKTGTTALQQHFFPRCPGTHYVGKPGANAVIRAITDLDDAAWTAQLDPTFRRVARLFGGPEDRVVLSEEEFSVGSLHGSVGPESIGRRLHLLFPRATVLFVVRNQLTLLCSLYGYAMAMPGTPHVGFNAWLESLRSVPSTGRGLHLFDYAALIGGYVGLFGRGRVEVLLYEDFVASPEAFLAGLARILGVDERVGALLPIPPVNVRPSLRLVQALRFAERHPWAGRAVAALPDAARRTLTDVVRRGPALDTRFSAANGAFVRRYYAESNDRLASLLGIDLAAHGYPGT